MIEAVSERALRVVNLHGPEGLGKTRLGQELLQILAGSGRPLRTYRFELAHAKGHSLLSTIVRERFELATDDESGQPPTPRDKLDRLAMGLTTLVPPQALDDALRLLGSICGLGVEEDGTPMAGFDPTIVRSDRFRRRADATALNLLKYEAAGRPHVFSVDDWDRPAYPRDTEMAQRVLQALSDRPALALIMSREPIDLTLPAPACVVSMALNPLPSGDLERLVEGLLENVEELPGDIVRTTMRQSAGSPLMAQELVRLLVQRGILRPVVPSDGRKRVRWVVRGERFHSGILPTDVDGAARQVLGAMGLVERSIVESAAVFGQTFWVDGVVSLARAEPDAEPVAIGSDRVRMKVEGALMTMCDGGLFELCDDPLLTGQPAMRFVNPTMQEAAEQGLDAPRRARLHRLAAQWLGAMKPSDRQPWLEMRAGHLEVGGLGRDAAGLYLETGDTAAQMNNLQRALELYRRGLTLISDDAAQVAAELLDRLARLYLATSEYDEAEACLADQIRMAAFVDDIPRIAEAHALIADVHRERGHYDRAREHLDHSMALSERHGHEAGAIEAQEKLAWLIYQRGDKDALHIAAEHLEATLNARRRRREPLAVAQALTTLGNVRYSMGQLEEAIELQREALQLRERHNDKRGQMLSLNGMGAARYDNGQTEEAIRLWSQAIALAEEVGDRTQHAILLMNLGEARMEAGSLNEAEPAIESALQTANELGLGRLQGIGNALLATVSLARGLDERALELADTALEVGYRIESKQVLGHALLAKARALSHTLFVDNPENEERQRKASESFHKSITLLEEMGEIPTLIRALEAYGTFLVERGVRNKGRKALERADKLRVHMRSAEQKEKTFHEARTIRRNYETSPVRPKEIKLVLEGLKGRGKKSQK